MERKLTPEARKKLIADYQATIDDSTQSHANLKAHFEALIAEQEAALEKEKPKPKHLDYWLSNGRIKIFAQEFNGSQRECVMDTDFLFTNIGSNHDGQKILGNLADLFRQGSNVISVSNQCRDRFLSLGKPLNYAEQELCDKLRACKERQCP